VGNSDIETVRTAFEAFMRGDLDAALEFCDPEIVVQDPGRTGRTFQGRSELRRSWEEWLENWQEYRAEPREVVEMGGQIFVHVGQTGRGKLSGIEIGQDLYQVFRLRDGRVVEYRIYADRGDAMESIGLTE
jgi:ketosteroid isomerase-like protein